MTNVQQSPQDILRYAQTAEGKRDPHLAYDALREAAPIWRDEDSGFIYVSSYAACDQILRSRSFGAAGLLQQEPRFDRSPSLQFLADTLSNIDPPHHTKLRSGIQKSFSVPVLKRSEALLAEVVAERVEALRDRTDFDVLGDYALTIPNTVICELLGVPRDDHVRFAGWLADQFRLLGPVPPSDELLDEVDVSTASLLDYMGALIEERRRDPRADIISELIAAQRDAEEPMSVREMTVTTSVLLAGGSDTTKTAIVIGTRLLLENPDQLADYLADPAAARPAFEEVLRLGGSVVLGNLRRAVEDVDLQGHRIAAGEIVVPVIAAANVDPAKFPDPLWFNIRRSPNPHIAFGGGVHVCVGNMMARMVGPVAISALVAAYPDMRMLDDGRDVDTGLPALRGMNSLRVTKKAG